MYQKRILSMFYSGFGKLSNIAASLTSPCGTRAAPHARPPACATPAHIFPITDLCLLCVVKTTVYDDVKMSYCVGAAGGNMPTAYGPFGTFLRSF